jgi:hypothetical protein
MILSEAHDLLTRVSHISMAMISSCLRTLKTSTFNLHFPSKCVDFSRVSSWIGRPRFTLGLHSESTNFHHVSSLIGRLRFTLDLWGPKISIINFSSLSFSHSILFGARNWLMCVLLQMNDSQLPWLFIFSMFEH